ncbi:MAG: hypothetical protein EOS34_32815 [Mesorhizobium sp.]|nr:MAG: hypothetical protein EOS34_32815 [Mesorhizobium sp.]
MKIQSKSIPRSVPYRHRLPNPAIPNLWLNLSGETQKQIAQSFARLLWRMRSKDAPIAADWMLRPPNRPVECVTGHRGKLAYIYVHPPVNQVRHHQESTELQYRLIDRAVALSWPHERMHVIDEDLGKSGAGTVERVGFKKLIAEIGWATPASSSASTRPRLPATTATGIAPRFVPALRSYHCHGERLPCGYYDRLLLGLSDITSEAELHQIRQRLHQGERQKSARGELRLPLPAGMAHDRLGEIILNPDEQVQARLSLRRDNVWTG